MLDVVSVSQAWMHDVTAYVPKQVCGSLSKLQFFGCGKNHSQPVLLSKRDLSSFHWNHCICFFPVWDMCVHIHFDSDPCGHAFGKNSPWLQVQSCVFRSVAPVSTDDVPSEMRLSYRNILRSIPVITFYHIWFHSFYPISILYTIFYHYPIYMQSTCSIEPIMSHHYHQLSTHISIPTHTMYL